jgi:hypothetical protein
MSLSLVVLVSIFLVTLISLVEKVEYGIDENAMIPFRRRFKSAAKRFLAVEIMGVLPYLPS